MRSLARMNEPVAGNERLLVAKHARLEFVDLRVYVLEDCLKSLCFASVDNAPIVLELLDVMHEGFGDFVVTALDA